MLTVLPMLPFLLFLFGCVPICYYTAVRHPILRGAWRLYTALACVRKSTETSDGETLWQTRPGNPDSIITGGKKTLNINRSANQPISVFLSPSVSSSFPRPRQKRRHKDKGSLNRYLVLFYNSCLLYTSPSPRDKRQSRMPSSA